jgi:hypothetical protein
MNTNQSIKKFTLPSHFLFLNHIKFVFAHVFMAHPDANMTRPYSKKTAASIDPGRGVLLTIISNLTCIGKRNRFS